MRRNTSFRDKKVVSRVIDELEKKLIFAYSCQDHLEKTGNLSKNQLSILYKIIQDNTYIQKSIKNDVGE